MENHGIRSDKQERIYIFKTSLELIIFDQIKNEITTNAAFLNSFKQFMESGVLIANCLSIQYCKRPFLVYGRYVYNKSSDINEAKKQTRINDTIKKQSK